MIYIYIYIHYNILYINIVCHQFTHTHSQNDRESSPVLIPRQNPFLYISMDFLIVQRTSFYFNRCPSISKYVLLA